MTKAEAGRGQPGGPVVNAEVLEYEHRAPIVERGLLQPGVAVEIGSDAGAQPALQRLRRVEAVQHFMGDLGIAGFVGSDQAQASAAEDGRESISKKEDGEGEEKRGLANARPGWQSPVEFIGRIRIGRLEERLEVTHRPLRRPICAGSEADWE